jgi:molecular chaperone GrpE
MALLKHLKSLRRKHAQKETMPLNENLTEQGITPGIVVSENERAAEQVSLDAEVQELYPTELPKPGEPGQEIPESSEVAEAVETVIERAAPSEIEQFPSPQEVPATPESQLDAELSIQIKSLTEEKDSLYNRLLRKQAEFENFRKRTEKEKQEFYEFALSNFIQAILPVLDGLEMSLSAQEGETVESFRKGNELILKQFRDQLWAAGIQPIRSMGKLFDPNYHQAVMREESSTLAENEIIEEYQRGYLFKDRLLRPSMVKVAVAAPASETDEIANETHEEEPPLADETATEG